MESALSLSRWSGTKKVLVLILLVLILLPFLYVSLLHNLDWHDTYRPAALAVLHGQSPYTVEIYYAAPWAAWLLIPIAVLPTGLGQMVIFLTGLMTYVFILRRLGAPPVSRLLFMSSAAVIGCLLNGNIEWMAAADRADLPGGQASDPSWLGSVLVDHDLERALLPAGGRHLCASHGASAVVLPPVWLVAITLFPDRRLEQRQRDTISVWRCTRFGNPRPGTPDP